jgi:hypothetical protein
MKSIEYFVDVLLERINKNFDNVVIIDSGSIKGTGKSSFSIKLCKRICEKIGYKYTYDLIIFNPTSEKIVDMVKNLPKGCPIHIDETSRVAYKRDWQKEFSKNLIKFINICRKFGKIVIFNNPDFWDLDKDLRNLADFRITILKRGMAQVRGKYANPEVEDKWLRVKSMESIDNNIKSDPTNIDNVIGALRKTPNFLFDLPFNELNPEEYDAYEGLSKVEELKGMVEKIDKWKIRSIALISIILDKYLTSPELMKVYNQRMSNYIHFSNITNAESLFLNEGTLREVKRCFNSQSAFIDENTFDNNLSVLAEAKPVLAEKEIDLLCTPQAEGVTVDYNNNNSIGLTTLAPPKPNI